MYQLVPRARVKKASIFHEPIERVVEQNLKSNIAEGIRNALATAR